MANFAPAKAHTAGIGAALTTTVGVLTALATELSHVQAVASATGLHLPPWVAYAGLGVAAVGNVLQAYSKPVNAGGTDIVPSEPAQ